MSTHRTTLLLLLPLALVGVGAACTAPPLDFGRPCASDGDCDEGRVCRAASDGTAICVGTRSEGDGGSVDDAGPRDAGPVDAGLLDGGQVDGGEADGGEGNGGEGDGGQVDGGVVPDAAVDDDAGPDAGPLLTPDGGPLLGPAELALGASHACVRFDTGHVKCWGDNTQGQLGLGDVLNRGDEPGELGDALSFVDLGPSRSATSLVAGQRHTCALLDDGSVRCWGYNFHGQLGVGDSANRGGAAGEMGAALPAVDLGAGAGVSSLAAGQQHTCALLDDGAVKCWGNNAFGQLGLGDANDRGKVPGEMGDALPAVDVGGGAVVTQLVAGNHHCCALLESGAVKCWGHNSYGQLGLGDINHRGDGPGEMGEALPAVDLDNVPALRLFAGGDATCALLQDESLRCWGRNHVGQLGLGDREHRGDGSGEMGGALPEVALGQGLYDVAVGGNHACALFNSGALKCWGQATFGELGTGNQALIGEEPGDVSPSLAAIDLGEERYVRKLPVKQGVAFTCAILDDQTVKCWGYNAAGQLGMGDTQNRGDDSGEMGNALPAVDLGAMP